MTATLSRTEIDRVRQAATDGHEMRHLQTAGSWVAVAGPRETTLFSAGGYAPFKAMWDEAVKVYAEERKANRPER